MKNATDVGLQTWEADVTCGVWCQGGSVRWLKTDHPQYTDASDVWVRGDDAIAALESLRAELAEAKSEIALLKTPNLVWDFDDPENSAVDSVADAVYQHIDWRGDTNVGDVMTFLTARKLSNVTVRITSVNDDGEVTFEAIDAAMAGGEK